MTAWCTNHIRIVARPSAMASIKERCKGVDESGELAPFRLESIKAPPTSEGDELTRDIDKATRGNPMRLALVALYRQTQQDLPDQNITMPMDIHLWRLCHWGTKWDVHARTTKQGEESDLLWTLTIETPWSPPIAAVQALADLFPEAGITLEYYEPSTASAGKIVWADKGAGLLREQHGHPENFDHCAEDWAEYVREQKEKEEGDVSDED